MNDNMLYYNVKLKTIGPLFIGDGGTLAKSEYVLNTKTNKIYAMDMSKMYDGLKKLNLLNEFEKFNMTESPILYDFVREYKLFNEYENWSKYSYSIDKDEDIKNMVINTFIKDAYLNPYVPGSSLKGALRNAILNSELITNNENYKNIASEVEIESKNFNNKNISKLANKMELSAGFTKFCQDSNSKDDNSYSIFSGLVISDSKPLSINDIILCGKYDISPNGKTKRLSLLRECIKPGTTIEFSVKIDKMKFNYNVDTIYKAINIMYNNTKSKFLDSFQSINSDRLNIKNPIYIGGGSGYVSKTATYSLFEDRDTAVKITSEILHNTTSVKKDELDHKWDYEKYRVSPRKRKCTKYKGQTYDFGLCSIEFEPIG